jgi:hypothetical protein
VLAAVIVALPPVGCAGGKKKENVIVKGVCKIANFTGGRSVMENYKVNYAIEDPNKFDFFPMNFNVLMTKCTESCNDCHTCRVN